MSLISMTISNSEERVVRSATKARLGNIRVLVGLVGPFGVVPLQRLNSDSGDDASGEVASDCLRIAPPMSILLDLVLVHRVIQ
jgi:hypothetical protein